MDLKKTINFLRRINTRDDTIYLILGLIEIDATNTVFFSGLEENEILAALLVHLKLKEPEYVENYLEDSGPENFLEYLAGNDQQLKFNVGDLERIIVEIKTKGEDHYEFTRFNRLGD